MRRGWQTQATAPSVVLPNALRALQYSDFRLLWTGNAISAVGAWMAIVAQSLLALQLAHGSAFVLGLVALSQAGAFFVFSPVAGSLVDRVDRRKLLVVTESLLALIAASLAWLTAAGRISVGALIALVFIAGSVLSFDQPARNSLLPALVSEGDIPNAISLQSAVFNGAAMLGPPLAGLLIPRFGYALLFWMNAISYGAVLVALALLKNVPTTRLPGAAQRGSLLAASLQGLRAIAKDTLLPGVIGAYATLLFFSPSPALLLPVLARQRLSSGAFTLGLLFAAYGCGTVFGSILIARLAGLPCWRRVLLPGYAASSVLLLVLPHLSSQALAMLDLLLFGAAQNAIAASSITLMQTRVAPALRGRIMSVNTVIIMGIRPLGDFPAAAVITQFGISAACCMAATVVAMIAALCWRRPLRLRHT